MIDMQAALQSTFQDAKQRGKDGRPCPFVPGVTPDMKPENGALLIRAWVLRHYPPDTYPKADRDALELLLQDIVLQWQIGALGRV